MLLLLLLLLDDSMTRSACVVVLVVAERLLFVLNSENGSRQAMRNEDVKRRSSNGVNQYSIQSNASIKSDTIVGFIGVEGFIGDI